MKNETRGYPNPNYDPEMIGTEPIRIDTDIDIDDSEYREIVSKAAALDILAADIKARIENNLPPVKDEVVLAVTGMTGLAAKGHREEYEDKYWLLFGEHENLKKERLEMQKHIDDLKARVKEQEAFIAEVGN